MMSIYDYLPSYPKEEIDYAMISPQKARQTQKKML